MIVGSTQDQTINSINVANSNMVMMHTLNIHQAYYHQKLRLLVQQFRWTFWSESHQNLPFLSPKYFEPEVETLACRDNIWE